MRPHTPHLSPVGDVLGSVLKRVDPERQLHAYTIWTFWNDEMGEAIARRAQPTRFRNGILFVTVATHSWLQELQFMKAEIRERLNARLGAEVVRDVYFTSGNVDSGAAEPPAEPRTPAVERHLLALPAIADPALAAAFTRIVEARARRLNRKRPGQARKAR